MAKPSPRYAKHPALIDLGREIQTHRTALGWSQEALAEMADMDRSYVGGIERGEHNPTVLNLIRISEALKMPLSSLLNSAGL